MKITKSVSITRACWGVAFLRFKGSEIEFSTPALHFKDHHGRNEAQDRREDLNRVTKRCTGSSVSIFICPEDFVSTFLRWMKNELINLFPLVKLSFLTRGCCSLILFRHHFESVVVALITRAEDLSRCWGIIFRRAVSFDF